MSKQADILAAIDEHWQQYVVPPPIRYISKKVHTSTSMVHYHYRELEKAGAIKMSGSPGSDPKPVPSSLFKLIKETLPNE